MEDTEQCKMVWQEKTERLDCVCEPPQFKQGMKTDGSSIKEIMALAPDTKELHKTKVRC